MLAAVGYYVLFQGFYNFLNYRSVWPYTSLFEAGYNIVQNALPIVMLFLLNVLVVFKMVRTELWVKWPLDFVLSFAISIGMNYLYLAVKENGYVDWAGTVLNNTLIFLIVEVFYYVIHFRHSQEQLMKQTRSSLQYKYDALKAQINPHFLFNSLNILASLIKIDGDKAHEFTVALSRMYRYIVQQQGKDIVPLTEELDFVRNYVDVLKMRYVDSFDVVFTHTELVVNQRIVPYTMQLLIENVTKHNLIATTKPMTVHVDFGQEGIEVWNVIQRREVEHPTHVGFQYLTELYTTHGKAFSSSNDGKVFTVNVPYL